MNKRILFPVLSVFSLVLFFYLGQNYYLSISRPGGQGGARQRAWEQMRHKIESEISRFKGDAGVIIKDLGTGREFSYNGRKLFASASMVKIPIMGSCFLAARENKLDLGESSLLKVSDKTSGSGTLKRIRPGTSFSNEELIGLMIYESDNTAANMLIDMLGEEYLNDSFRRFGLKDTNISRRIADFASRDKGVENYTSAQDIACMLELIYEGKLVDKQASDESLIFLKLQRVNDRIPRYLPKKTIVAHKTGLERSVCHDAGIVFTDKGDFLVTVLTGHSNSTSRPSKRFIARVALRVYEYSRQL
ncbi:MAG: serine hydrolase [Candidatus Omnitrophota bacterium]